MPFGHYSEVVLIYGTPKMNNYKRLGLAEAHYQTDHLKNAGLNQIPMGTFLTESDDLMYT